MAVMVTGASGLVGAAVVRELVARARGPVIAFDARPPATPFDGADVTLCLGDLLDAAVIARTIERFGVDRVVHAAGLLTMMSEEYPTMACTVNIGGTIAVLEAARTFGLGRVVLVSSRSVYGVDSDVPLDEEVCPTPRNFYGVSKLTAERFGEHYAHAYGVDFLAVRLPVVYGGRQLSAVRVTHPIAEIVERVARGEAIVVRGGDHVLAMIHVRDVARGVVLATLAGGLEHRIYNLGSGETVTLREVAAILQRLVPQADITVEAGCLTTLPTSAGVDIGRARRELGWEPTVSVEAGIREYLESVMAADAVNR
jgi:nucleoside-diphosphate-sugar epimerase